MARSTTDLRMIAGAGGGLVLDAGRYSTTDLRMIAAALVDGGATLRLINAEKKSTTDLRMIAAAKPGQVIFECLA